MPSLKAKWAERWNRCSTRFRTTRVSAQRLSGDVQEFEARFEARPERARGKSWAKAVRRHRDAARLAAAERRISAGYESLPAAERDEPPLEAVQRELREELGLEATAPERVAKTPTLISDRLEESHRNGRIGQGQTQAWFLFRMKGDGAAEVTAASEFRKLQWVALADAVGLTDDFRREACRQLSQAFAQPLQMAAAKPRKSTAGRPGPGHASPSLTQRQTLERALRAR